MNNFIKILSAVFVAMALSMPSNAQSRHNGGNNRQSTERRTQSNQGASRSQVNNGSSRKDNSKSTQQKSPSVNNRNPQKNQQVINRGNTGNQNGRVPANGSQQPGRKPNNQSGQQPGNPGSSNPSPSVGQRPGQGTPPQGGQRPGQGVPPQGGQRPGPNVGNVGRPQPPVASHRLPQPPLQRPVMLPPMRIDRPPMHPYSRPLPPPTWRPVAGGPVLSTILGITLGTAIDISLNYLYSKGFIIDGYDRDVVYLRNVNQLNYIWPDAALFYNPYGLTGSRFIYSSPYFDLNRYNRVYSDLVRLYGAPAQLISQNSGYIATWFGLGNDFVQLQFSPEFIGGATRYVTTLSFGN